MFEEINILAMLLQHADQQIDKSITMFLTLLGVVATFTMTNTYQEKFNWFLKVILSVSLTVLLWVNRDAIIDQMIIYNALLEQMPVADEPWKTLFENHTIYHKLNATMMFWVHAIASFLIHALIWHQELKNYVGPWILKCLKRT